MRRCTRAAAAAIAMTIAFPMSVHAGSDHDDERVAPATDRVEALRLECGVGRADGGPVVGCAWSAPTSPNAVGVRLSRLDAASDEHRRVIFRTDDLGVAEYTDSEVRPGHRYAYAVQAVDRDGRVVGRSRTEWVGVPKAPEVEALRLECSLGSAGEAIGCEWSHPTGRDAYVVTLWRSVDGGARAIVERFRPSGPTAYRDPVPIGASKVTYAVIATAESDRIVARSRPATVRIPGGRPSDVAPTDVREAAVWPTPPPPPPPTPSAPVRPVASPAVDARPAARVETPAVWLLPVELRARVLRLVRDLAAL